MKIIIIYHYIAHYRLPIFQELKSSKKLNVNIAAGINTDSSIKVVKPNLLDFLVLDNKWIFKKKMIWQKGVLNLLFKNYDHYIFLGNPYFISTWIALILCKLLGKKGSIWTHGVTTDLIGLKRIIFSLFWKLSDKIFLYGHYAEKKMIEYKVPKSKLVVVYNSLDYQEQIKYRNRTDNNIYGKHFDNDYPVIIFIGRLTKVKKLDLVLEAVKRLKEKEVNCNLVFVGKGEEDQKLKNLSKELNLENNCWFYGACYEEEIISQLFHEARICVSPGNVGLTAMHALVYGTPVVTHSNFQNQMPEFEAIVDGLTGSFFEQNNLDDLSNKMSYWINMESNEFYNRRKACYKIIDEKYNPDSQCKIFEDNI